jgi:ubiquinone/menaquinone biosynthesis C-methylase UbiE
MAMTADSETHWARWHRDYDDPSSALSKRLELVCRRVDEAIVAVQSPEVRLVSLCSGQGRDVVAALRNHPRRDFVSGLLVDTDSHNVGIARRSLRQADLPRIEVIQADASNLAVLEDWVPADVLLLCGIFGNISDEDVHRTIDNASRCCAPGAYLIWTRHLNAPDLTPQIRRWFANAGYEEQSFDSPPDTWVGVGMHKLSANPLLFDGRVNLFTFHEID